VDGSLNYHARRSKFVPMNEVYVVCIDKQDANYSVEVSDTQSTCNNQSVILDKGPGIWEYNIHTGGAVIPVCIETDGMLKAFVSIRGYRYPVEIFRKRHHTLLDILASSPALQSRTIRISAPMPGLIKSVFVTNNSVVKKGETLFTLEAMKMENAITAPSDGMVHDLQVETGQTIEKGGRLCTLAPLHPLLQTNSVVTRTKLPATLHKQDYLL